MLPDGWENANLGTVCQIATGGTPNRAVSEYWNGDIPWMSSGEINQRIVRSVAEHISALGMANSNASPLPPGTVMMALNGQGKTRGKVALLAIETTCNQSLAGLIAEPTRLLPDYLFYSLDAQYQDIRNITGDDARNGLNLGLLRALTIALPPLDEQHRIAEVLRSVDDTIAAQRATCNQHTRLMDAVFEAWSNQSAPMVALGDLLDLKNGINFEKEERADEGTLTLDVMNMFSDDMTPTYEGAYRISKAVPSDLILQSGDVLFVRSSVKREGVGWTSLADGFDEMTTFCGFIIRGRPKRDDVLSRYVVGVLRAPKYRRWLIQHSTRSALTNINQKAISSAVIPLPSFEQQQALVGQYERLAAAAFDCKTALATLEALRTELADDLLSGKVQVPA